jgi:hypothetical protein
MALRCLIVADSADFREAARVLLEQQGVTVVAVASSGEEATSISDLDGESGFAVARELVDDGSVDARLRPGRPQRRRATRWSRSTSSRCRDSCGSWKRASRTRQSSSGRRSTRWRVIAPLSNPEAIGE